MSPRNVGLVYEGRKKWRFWSSVVIIRIKGLAELIVSVDVKFVFVDKPVLLDLESTIKVALEGGFCGGLEEEKVSESEMEGCNEEAYGLHNIPAKFPECEPHESQGLYCQEAQSTIKLASDQGFCFLVNYCLLLLQLLQFHPSWVIWMGYCF